MRTCQHSGMTDRAGESVATRAWSRAVDSGGPHRTPQTPFLAVQASLPTASWTLRGIPRGICRPVCGLHGRWPTSAGVPLGSRQRGTSLATSVDLVRSASAPGSPVAFFVAAGHGRGTVFPWFRLRKVIPSRLGLWSGEGERGGDAAGSDRRAVAGQGGTGWWGLRGSPLVGGAPPPG